ncbi:hypothetical protein [Endozoicomonas sp. 8E]|uniref:hypothetical protein n=1 Tax=Endozoicomonas sp. 8E TaxID=3035692 RepID=UPI00293926A8|nr:hypothetical protein [Endozoicomonas sp. 8E]WOG28118.1 hypothetical protein P6910_00250 [Endozoicomonas sp. 8E]
MIWIIALIALIIIGNFMWLLPSKSDRRRMKLRNKAILSGFTCREINDKESLPGSINIEQGPWLEYSTVSLTEDNDPVIVLEKADGRWPVNTRVGSEKLSRLPASAVRVSFRTGSIAVLWNEEGELEDVQTIMDFLESVAVTEPCSQQ